MPNRLSYPAKNWVLDNGGKVLWEEGLFTKPPSRTLRVRFFCAAKKVLGDECKGEGDARASHVLGRRGRRFRALHEKCYRKILGRADADKFVTPTKPASTGEFPLPQGTIALLHKRLPSEGKKFARVAIKCHGCFDESERNFKYVNSLNLRLYAKGCLMRALALVGFFYATDKTTWCRAWPHLSRYRFWSELCSNCIDERGSIDRFIGWKTAPSGTRVYFSRDRQRPARVVYALCRCTKRVPRDNAINNYDELRAACRKHAGKFLDRIAVEGMHNPQISQPQHGNGHKGAEATKPDGKLEAERAVFEEIVGALLNTLPARRIKRPRIAQEYDRRGRTREAMDPSNITKIVQRCYGRGVSVEDAVELVEQKLGQKRV